VLQEGDVAKGEKMKETLPESISGMVYVIVIGLFALTFVTQNFVIPWPRR
jgi:signal peptidase I